MKFFTQFDPPKHEGFSSKEPSLTKQSFKDDCDANVIVERFTRTGLLPSTNQSPIYGDFANVHSYQEALHLVMDAQDQFFSLDSKIRDRFHNDPSKFLEFCSDPNNRDEMIKLGLIEPKIDSPTTPDGQNTSTSEQKPLFKE